MHPYPKQIFTLQQQIQSYVDAGMVIEPNDSAEDVLTRIGYDAVIDLNRINFPTDWEAHFTV